MTSYRGLAILLAVTLSASSAHATDGTYGACRSLTLVDSEDGRPIRGAEDIAVDHTAGIAYISAYDRWGVEDATDSGAALPQGGIYALPLAAESLNEDPVTVVDVTRGFKRDRAFHPHGIALTPGPQGGPATLGVINRRIQRDADGVVKSEPTIELFDIADGALRHRRTVADPAICRPNDLVVLNSGSLLVTNDRGQCEPPGVWLETAFGLSWSNVMRVDFSGAEATAPNVTKVANDVAFANGIAVDQSDPTKFVVAGTRDRALHVFGADQEANETIYRPLHRITLDGAPDNVTQAQDGEWVVAAHPSLFRLARHLRRWFGDSPAPSRVLGISDGSGQPRVLFEDKDGSLISAATVAVRHGDLLLIGSVTDERLALCTAIPSG